MLTALTPEYPAATLPNLFSGPAPHPLRRPLRPRRHQPGKRVLLRALNAIAINPATRATDARVTGDRRFPLSVAVPLLLQGRPARPDRFSEVERRVARAARDRGAAEPAGRALEAAKLITCAVSASSASEAVGSACRAVDLAIESEVLAASLQGRDLVAARADAEPRALDILQPTPPVLRRR